MRFVERSDRHASAAAPPQGATEGATGASPPAAHGGKLALALGALGVVYGDIGTSPLYAVRECFYNENQPAHALPLSPPDVGRENVLGVVSLVFWSLTAVVSLKYLVFIMRASNRGEGGIFALLALLPKPGPRFGPRLSGLVVLMALAGAGLLYGDGIITPAISVLSAVDGLKEALPAAARAVVPLTVAILLALFLVQRWGTGAIGRLFGPIMAVWFVTIGILGFLGVVREPAVLAAVWPGHALSFFARNGFHGFLVLGSVVLCITGAEALYADMGHFGRVPIETCWFSLVKPALLLSYFGQGALLLAAGETAKQNPFYSLAPKALLIPLVVLSTVATVIASQALISGAFSLTRQAMQLGYCPRMTVVHTSGRAEGQIYIPEINKAMMVACIALVLWFKSSSALGAAYGLAVTAVMGVTSVLFYFVATRTWGWRASWAGPLVAVFLAFDLTYFGANCVKFLEGGWVPALVGLLLLVAFATWRDGRAELSARMRGSSLAIDLLLDDIARRHIHRVAGTAVFMSPNTEGAPPALLHHLKHNKVLHEKVVLLAVNSLPVPIVPRDEQLTLEPLREGFWRLIARYGFMETPDVPDVLRRANVLGLSTDPAQVSYFLSRETLILARKGRLPRWRRWLFAFMARNARPANAFFGLPPGRVVEMGIQVEI